MNLLALIGTVWLFTTPALVLNGRYDRIGFIGSTVVEAPADGIVADMTGTDRTVGFDFTVDAYDLSQPIDETSTGLIVVHADVNDLFGNPAGYCEAFIVQHQARTRMAGAAVFFYEDCQTVLVAHRRRWHARRLY